MKIDPGGTSCLILVASFFAVMFYGVSLGLIEVVLLSKDTALNPFFWAGAFVSAQSLTVLLYTMSGNFVEFSEVFASLTGMALFLLLWPRETPDIGAFYALVTIAIVSSLREKP
jgi:hypothetical protein